MRTSYRTNARTNSAQMHKAAKAPEHAQLHTPLGGAVCVQTVSAQVKAEKPSELLLGTFGGTLWVKTPNGERGARPDWLDWPSHTAAEMAPIPEQIAPARNVRRGSR